MSEWVITCNLKTYDVVSAFDKLDELEWKQSTRVENGDIVYIYVGAPISAIKYKCEAISVNLSNTKIDDSEFVIDDSNYGNYGNYMRLHLLNTYDDHRLQYILLKRNGLKTVQGPSIVSKELSVYLNTINENDVDEEISLLLSDDINVIIRNSISVFNKRLSQLLKKEKKFDKLRRKFVDDYSIKKITNMTKKEYVVGFQNKNSFCYRLENELQESGNIHGATSKKFGIYYGKEGSDTQLKYRSAMKFGNNVDDAFEKVKKEIVELRIAGEEKDYYKIRKCKLSPMVKGKLLSVFFPEDYFCIFSDDHLDYFLRKLKINFSDKDDMLDKQNKLMDLKKNNPDMKGWSNYIFSEFLYEMFGHPLRQNDSNKDKQKKRDNEYPKDYVSDIGISKKQWIELLKNTSVFKDDDIQLLKQIYKSDNHAIACSDLEIINGISIQTYILQVVTLAKKIAVEINLKPIKSEGKQVWWRVLFWGKYREDSKFEWKLQPDLANAIAELYPELKAESYKIAEEKEDELLVTELKDADISNDLLFEYNGVKKRKPIPVYTSGHRTYPRDRHTAINALAHAHFLCEVDGNHPTFIRKKCKKNYTEPHHLVPMAYSDEFAVSLDVEENIVSLCSNCHNKIHYGKDADKLVKKLYAERKDLLFNVGIDISLSRLLEMYGYR